MEVWESFNPKDEDGKDIVRAESRPLGWITYFTCAGDSETNIGDGKVLAWDFANTDDEIDAPPNFRRKRIVFGFLDDVRIKDGAIYFFGAQKGSYGDLYVVCPAGATYLNNDGSPAVATEDTIVNHYVNHHLFQGDCPMGDELNTESCSPVIPSSYRFWLEITVPNTDASSNGYVSLELYRKRTVIL